MEKILLAKSSLEGHDRGARTVARAMRDAGMEVVLLGNALSERIIGAAIQESADVVGVSTYCGGELALGRDLLKAAEKAGIKETTVFLLGGIFPSKNALKLKQVGFSATFPPSASTEEIVSSIENALATKQKNR